MVLKNIQYRAKLIELDLKRIADALPDWLKKWKTQQKHVIPTGSCGILMLLP